MNNNQSVIKIVVDNFLIHRRKYISFDLEATDILYLYCIGNLFLLLTHDATL